MQNILGKQNLLPSDRFTYCSLRGRRIKGEGVGEKKENSGEKTEKW